MQNLRVMVWKEKTAEYMAMLTMVMNILSMCCSSYFGRFSDKFGRRLGAAIFGICTFAPAWMLQIFGFNSTGLYASSAAFIVSGCCVGTDSILVLTSDVTREEDRPMIFGLFQSIANVTSFVLFGFPAILITLMHVIPNPSVEVWLMYQTVLALLYFIVLWRVRPSSAATFAAATAAAETEGSPEASPTMSERSTETVEAPDEAAPRRRGFCQLLSAAVPGFDLVRASPELRKLYACSFFLLFGGDVVFDLGSLYFRDELGLLQHGSLEQQQQVSVLATLPPQLAVMPLLALTGLLAQRWGSMVLLKVLIPISAIMISSGTLLALFPYIWMVPIICVALNVASMASNVPLKHLIAEQAPPERVGEAMGVLGMVGQTISFLANAVVASTTPVMYQLLEKPLWIYYLACGIMTALALIPVASMANHLTKAAWAAKDEPDLERASPMSDLTEVSQDRFFADPCKTRRSLGSTTYCSQDTVQTFASHADSNAVHEMTSDREELSLNETVEFDAASPSNTSDVAAKEKEKELFEGVPNERAEIV